MLIRIVGLTALKNSTAFELLVHIGRVNDKNKIDREKCRSLHTLPSIANWYTLVQTNGRARADDLLQGLIELVRLRVCPRLSSIFNSLSSSRTIHTAIEGTRVYFFFSHMPMLFPPPPSAYVFFALLFSGRSKVTSRKNCKQPTMCVFFVQSPVSVSRWKLYVSVSVGPSAQLTQRCQSPLFTCPVLFRSCIEVWTYRPEWDRQCYRYRDRRPREGGAGALKLEQGMILQSGSEPTVLYILFCVHSLAVLCTTNNECWRGKFTLSRFQYRKWHNEYKIKRNDDLYREKVSGWHPKDCIPVKKHKYRKYVSTKEKSVRAHVEDFWFLRWISVA